MTFDPTKPVMTRAGKPARIIATDVQGEPIKIVALVEYTEGAETTHCYLRDGRHYSGKYGEGRNEAYDLVNERRPGSGFLTLYGRCGVIVPYWNETRPDFNLMDSARGHDHGKRLACVEVSFKEGDGLDD
jgi:hypothetical protein